MTLNERMVRLSRLSDELRTFFSNEDRSTKSAWLIHDGGLVPNFNVLTLEEKHQLKSWADQEYEKAEKVRKERAAAEAETKRIGLNFIVSHFTQLPFGLGVGQGSWI